MAQAQQDCMEIDQTDAENQVTPQVTVTRGMDAEMRESVVRIISSDPHLAKHWRRLYSALGLNPAELDRMANDYSLRRDYGISDLIDDMLKAWTGTNVPGNTLERLIFILRQEEFVDCAEKIEDKFVNSAR